MLMEAAAAVLPLPGDRHPSDRFNAYVTQHGLNAEQRDALWRVIMLRPRSCTLKLLPGQASAAACYCPMCAPWLDDALCGCNTTCADEDDDELPQHSRRPLSVCYVYPCYDYEFQPADGEAEAVAAARRSAEAVAHAYMVRMRRLPAPLPPSMYSDHAQLLSDALPQRPAPRLVPCNGHTTRRLALDSIADAARRSETLLLVLCGHGRERDGALMLSDGSALGMGEVATQLRRVRFTGRVVCVLNACHAGPPPLALPPPWGDELPFQWQVLHSCDWDEGQKPSHAAHLMRLVAALLRERPEAAQLQQRVDGLWVQTRTPEQRPSLWRGPPTLSASRNASGRLLGLPVP